MGYRAIRQKSKRGEGWRVLWREHRDYCEQARHVPKSEYAKLGLRPDMTLAEAQAVLKRRNVEQKRRDREAKAIERRLAREKETEHLCLPKVFEEKFLKRLQRDHGHHPLQLRKLRSHWETARKVIKQADLPVDEWHRDPNAFYLYFINEKISWEYTKKLIRMINLWGKFLTWETRKPFEGIPTPPAHIRASIIEARRKVPKKSSKILTPETLKAKGARLKPEQYNWLYLSVWLGLRPSEIDALRDPDTWELGTSDGVPVLRVYQAKLIRLEPEERWKLIPLFLDEQKACIEIIESKAFKRPLTKTIREHLGAGLTTYAGRKSFYDLMRSHGQEDADISQWLGHRSLKITWAHYKDFSQVRYKKKAA